MEIQRAIDQAADALRGCQSVLVFAGAGLSAESGLATFRDQGGLWEGHRVEDVATPEGFARDPVLVWRFYAARQQRQWEVEPNAGHLALARMEQAYSGFLLVTQNVDNLSERAGSKKLVKIHGDLMQAWCTRCPWRGMLANPVSPDDFASRDGLPKCPQCGHTSRPGVVWFGELLPPGALEKALLFSASAKVLISVGTSGLVSGGYGLAETTRAAGGMVIEINPADTYLSRLAHICIRGQSGRILPALLTPAH